MPVTHVSLGQDWPPFLLDDLNQDGLLDVADATLAMANVAADPAPAGRREATAEYNTATGLLLINANDAVNVYVESASASILYGGVTRLSPPLLISDNAHRVGVTGLNGVGSFVGISFGGWGGNIGAGLSQDDLTLSKVHGRDPVRRVASVRRW